MAEKNLPKNYFLTEKDWDIIRINGDYDYVVIGSSFCAMGVISQLQKNSPNAKILIIEQGAECTHFQDDLSPIQLGEKEKSTETNPWRFFPAEGEYIKSVRGMNNFFGGRSSFWKAWCPKPTREEMAGWPDEVIKTTLDYFDHAKALLSVQPVNEIGENGRSKKPFGTLQQIIYKKLESAPAHMEEITRVEHAPLAVIKKNCRNGDFQKYSVLTPLLDIIRSTNVKCDAVVNCLVKKIHHDDKGKATHLETSNGEFDLGSAKLILAMSTLPSTTLMLNSFMPSQFKRLSGIGKHFTAHFMSTICARVPIYAELQDRDIIEMGALYVAGEDSRSKHQFHLQITAVAVGDEKKDDNYYDDMRNLLKTPSKEKLETCKNHIVFTCVSLGQLDHVNPKNIFELNDDKDITKNATLHLSTTPKDKDLWNTMDESTYKILNELTPNNTIEFWNRETKLWQVVHPPARNIRLAALVHPASTMQIGTDADQTPVNLDYLFRGVDNVYLTGGALWPTGASWNPTCVMTALAMDLADRLSKNHLPKSRL